MTQAITLLLVVGVIGAVALGVAKRCEWFNICGGGKINPATGTDADPVATEKYLKTVGQDSATIAPQITQQLASSPISDAKQAKLPAAQRQTGCKVVNGKLSAVNSSGTVIGPCQSGLGAYTRARFSRIAI